MSTSPYSGQSQLTEPDIQSALATVTNITKAFETSIIGQKTLINSILIALMCDGHILLEGVPGLAKTRAVKVIADTVSGSFKRIQFTPDLLPSDVIGNQIFNPKTAEYYTKLGPVFANFVLADEINRAPAKVQSALLEAMQEKQVTIAGETYMLPKPFLVLATQNPIEQEGTYQLPEAQVDRFLMKTVVSYPSWEEEVKMLTLLEREQQLATPQQITLEEIARLQELTRQVYIDDKIKQYIATIIFATRFPEQVNLGRLKPSISYGASPRGAIAFLKVSKAIALMNNRNYVIPEDIKAAKHEVLRHRLILSYEAEADGLVVEQVIDDIVQNIRVP
jgi:MoxR-like ATPase